MTEIDPAVVEKFGGYGLRCYTCDASGRNVEHTSWKFTRDELREAMIAINLPDLLRKEREYDEMQMQLAGKTAQYEHATAYTVVHRGTLIYCSDAMRQAYSDQSVALDALLARVEAAPVEVVEEWQHGLQVPAASFQRGKRVRLLVEQEG
jgi:hypothetical protein